MKEFLTLEEVLDYLKISRATLYRMIGAGLIGSYKIPGSKRNYFQREEVLKLFVPSNNHPKTLGSQVTPA